MVGVGEQMLWGKLEDVVDIADDEGLFTDEEEEA